MISMRLLTPFKRNKTQTIAECSEKVADAAGHRVALDEPLAECSERGELGTYGFNSSPIFDGFSDHSEKYNDNLRSGTRAATAIEEHGEVGCDPDLEPRYAEHEMFAPGRSAQTGAWKIYYTTTFAKSIGTLDFVAERVVQKDVHHGQLREAVNKACLQGQQAHQHAYSKAKNNLDFDSQHVAGFTTCHWEVYDPDTGSALASGIVLNTNSERQQSPGCQ